MYDAYIFIYIHIDIIYNIFFFKGCTVYYYVYIYVSYHIHVSYPMMSYTYYYVPHINILRTSINISFYVL